MNIPALRAELSIPVFSRNSRRQRLHVPVESFDGKPLAARDLDDLRQTLVMIPDRFLAKRIILGVRLCSAESLASYGGGAYSRDGRVIEVVRDENFPFNLAHEIGEAIYENGLEPHERAKFVFLLPGCPYAKAHQLFANYVEQRFCGKSLFPDTIPLTEEACLFIDRFFAAASR